VKGLGNFLARSVARGVPNGTADGASEPVPVVARDAPVQGDVEAFFAAQGVQARRAIFTSSVESRRLKALAQAQGITPGRLWHAAKQFASDAQRTYELASREATDIGPGILHGYAAAFNQWREVNTRLKGNYLQRIAPGTFGKTVEARGEGMKVTLQHGKDPELRCRSLGPITLLEEDAYGLRYEVQLLDVDYVRELAPWLRTGLYGASLTFEVLADDFVVRPGKSAHNPRGIPEQTVREIRLQELGPVYPPAFSGTTAGIR
jgi:phage head maturation protease